MCVCVCVLVWLGMACLVSRGKKEFQLQRSKEKRRRVFARVENPECGIFYYSWLQINVILVVLRQWRFRVEIEGGVGGSTSLPQRHLSVEWL